MNYTAVPENMTAINAYIPGEAVGRDEALERLREIEKIADKCGVTIIRDSRINNGDVLCIPEFKVVIISS